MVIFGPSIPTNWPVTPRGVVGRKPHHEWSSFLTVEKAEAPRSEMRSVAPFSPS